MKNPRSTRQKEPPTVEPEQTEQEISILLNPPEGNYFAQWIAREVRGRIRAIMKAENDVFESPLIYSQIKETIREALTEMEAATDWYKTDCSQFLYDTGTEFSNRAWIRNNGKIMANINKPRNSGLLPMMEYLAESQIPFLQSRVYGKMEFEGKEEYPILVIPNIAGIAKRINRSTSQVVKYIAGAEGASLIGRLGPKHRGSFLVLGYHDFYKDEEGKQRRRAIYFLKDTPAIREALRTFRRPD